MHGCFNCVLSCVVFQLCLCNAILVFMILDSVALFQGLIHSMSIFTRLIFFLERRSSGECFIQLILLCRNISDMVHGTAENEYF